MIKKYTERHKLIRFLLVIIAIICFLVLDMLLVSVAKIETTKKESDEKLEAKEYKLVDSLDQYGNLRVFFDDVNRLEDVKKFVNLLENNANFNSYQIHFNSTGLINSTKTPKDVLSNGDDSRIELKPGYYLDVVNAIHITQNLSKNQNIIVSKGESFHSDDFEYKKDGDLKILAGSSYEKDFELNEKIQIDNWGLFMDAEIIGFLDDESYVIWFDEEISLSNYIVLPLLNFDKSPTTVDENSLQAITYTTRINSTLYSDTATIDTIYDEVDRLSLIYDLPPFQVINVSRFQLGFTSAISSMGIDLLIRLAVMLLIFTALAYCFAEIYIFQKNKYCFGIHILSGMSRNDITKLVIADTLKLLMLSNVIVVMIMVAMGQPLIYLVINLIISCLISVLLSSIFRHSLKTSGLADYLSTGDE